MDAVLSFQPQCRKSLLKRSHAICNSFSLVVYDKAYQIKTRRHVIGIERSRFVNENTYVRFFHLPLRI